MVGQSSSSKRPRRAPDLTFRDAMPYPNQPLTPSGYRGLSVPSSSAIVVDFGSSTLRAGFSSDMDSAPRLHFPPYVGRGRETGAHGVYSQVGYEALASANRSAARSPFDGSVANNATLVERLMDGVLLRLGLAEEDAIQHPIVFTEPVCQPNGVRAQFMELAFEGYKAPQLCFGIDALFSYYYNGNVDDQNGGRRYARKSGIVVSCGYNATHVMAVNDFKLHGRSTKRINIGGHGMTNHFSRRLQLRNPEYATCFTYPRSETLKHDLCYVSEKFDKELKKIRNDVEEYEKACKILSIPGADTGGGERQGSSAEEQERVRIGRIERGRRLSVMMKERNRAKAAANAAAKRAAGEADAAGAVVVSDAESAPLLEARNALRELQKIEEAREQDEDLYYLALVAAGYNTEGAFLVALEERKSAVETARDNLGEAKADTVDALWAKRSQEDELIAVSDTELRSQGLKRKRHLRALRGAAEARKKMKKKKDDGKLREQEELENQRRRREEDPEKFLAELCKERSEIAERIRRRKATKDAGSDRRSGEARRRMWLLAQHAGTTGLVDDVGPSSKGTGKRREKKVNDTFGMNDSDWDVYRDMRVREDAGEEESENDSAIDRSRLDKLRQEIVEMNPDDEDPTLVRRVGSALLYVPHPHPDEIPIVIERLATPEMLFQPNLIGLEQCGIAEAVELIVRSFPEDAREAIVKEVFFTGGVSWTTGLEARMRRELVTCMPTEWADGIKAGVRRAGDPQLDAWRGAKHFAETGGSAFEKACVSKADYEEMGAHYMVEHGMSNMRVPTPTVDPADAERRKKLQSYKRTTVK